MSQRHDKAVEELGINTLAVLDTHERSQSARNSLGNGEWPRVSDAARSARSERVSELLPERRTLGVSLLGDVAQDNGVRLSVAGPSPNNYKIMAIVLPILWFSVGVGNCIPGPSYQQWVVGVNIDPAQQTLFGVVGGLPWNIKIFVAFLSDIVPICGRRRLPYLAIGLILKGSAWFLLGVFGNHITFPLLALQQFCATLGQMMTGVMCDTLIVENVKYEVQEGQNVGQLQTNCWMWFSIGGLLGGVVSGWVPEFFKISYLTMFMVDGVFHLTMMVMCMIFVKDPKFERTGRVAQSIRSTWADMWSTMTLVRVLCPIIFIIAYALCPSGGASFNTYIVQKRELCMYNGSSCVSTVIDEAGHSEPGYVDFCNQFSAEDTCNSAWGGLGFGTGLFATIGIVGSVGSVIGSFVFKRWFINSGWHKLFASVVIIASVSSALQIVLCFRDPETGKTPNEKLHIPDSVFALGDDVVMAASNQLLSMPILILMSRLCPEGAEGTVYAMVTSIQGVGGTVSGILSRICINAFGVTNTNFEKLWQLILITSLAKILSILFLPLVPRNLDDNSDGRRHWLCGTFILCCFLGGMGWAFFQIIQNLLLQ